MLYYASSDSWHHGLFFGGHYNEWKDFLDLFDVKQLAVLVLLDFSCYKKDRTLLSSFSRHQVEERQFNMITLEVTAVTFCDSFLSGGARKRRKKQLNYLLQSRVVWEQQKKETCQTRCKVVRPGEREQDWRGYWDGKRLLSVWNRFWCYRSVTCWSTDFLYTSASLLIFSLNRRNHCKSWQSTVTLLRYFDVLDVCLESSCLHSWSQTILRKR